MYDIAIIGAGIVGSFLARDLSRYQVKTIVLEKNGDVANGATMANSAIIHSGHDPKEGTLKAALNVRGNEMYPKICKELGVDFQRTSAFVVAAGAEEEEKLKELFSQSQRRNIPAKILDRQAALQLEPNLSDQITQVLELPSTGIIYPWEVAIALMEEASLNGVEVLLEHPVTSITKQEDCFIIQALERKVEARYVINAAGVYADTIYEMVSGKKAFQITPRKGEYYVLDQLKKPLVKRVIYPVPSKNGKGVLVVPTTHGNYLLGPNSQFIDDKEGIDNTKAGLDYVKKEIQKTVKNVPMDKVIRVFAGLRPTGDTEDFCIEEAEDVKGFVQAACIESPGLASAPAISEYILEEIIKKKWQESLPLIPKTDYVKRRPCINMSKMTKEERDALVKKDSSFARVVCRCEQITEGEIIDAIRRPVGGRSVKGIKKRVRPGMGRCQGGFCEPLVVDILARELGIRPTDVRLDGKASVMLMGETKAAAPNTAIGTHERNEVLQKDGEGTDK